MVHGPQVELAELRAAQDEPALAGHHRTFAVRAHLLEFAGDRNARTRQAYSLLRTILNTAKDDGLILDNPCRSTGAGQHHVQVAWGHARAIAC